MQNECVSIVVPVYKVENYLERCIQSIVSQTYTSIEIILVDDGSPDNCGKICDFWVAKDSRIKCLHKRNGGLSDARNCGVACATGSYITFIDSDDYVAPNYIEYLYGLVQINHADIAVCNFRKTNKDDEDLSKQDTDNVLIFSNIEACEKFQTNKMHNQLVIACGKLFLTKIVRENPFPVGVFHEDEATTYKMLYASCKIAVSNLELYAYFQNESSITHNITKRNERDALTALEDRIDFFTLEGQDKLAAMAYNSYIGYMMTSCFYNYKSRIRNLFFSSMFNRKILLKTKIKIMYYLIAGKAPKRRVPK